MHQIDLGEAKKHLSDLLEEAINGQEVMIVQNQQPIVKFVPMSPTKVRPQFGSAKGLITINKNFDDPLEDLQEYMK